MFALLAYVDFYPTKVGVSFKIDGAWEYDPVKGSGRVKLGKDGCLSGRIKIRGSDESRFTAVRVAPPDDPISNPPSYNDKWSRKW
jgi:hypothetical protein